MKHVLLLAFCVLLSARVLSAQSFTVSLTPASQSITVGETATYSVIITPLSGFTATVFLSSSFTNFQGQVELSATTSNPPYTGITLRVRPTMPDTGLKTFTVTGKNGAVQSVTNCNLSTMKNVQWTIIRTPYPTQSGFVKRDPADDICMSWYARSENSNEFICISHYRNHTWETDKITTSPPKGGTVSFAYDKTGQLWCAAMNGITRYDGKFSSFFAPSVDIPMSENQYMVMGKNGLPVYITSSKYDQKAFAMVEYDGSSWKTTKSDMLTMDYHATWGATFCIDSSGKKWIPTSRGVVRFDGATQEMVGSPAFMNKRVTEVICDRDGGIWYMYYGSKLSTALSYFDGTPWKDIASPTSRLLLTFFVDNDKHVWLVSEEGLHYYDGLTWTSYTKDNSPYGGGSTLITQDKNKNVWLSTSGGFYVFNPTGLVDIPLAPSGVDEQPAPSDGLSLYPNPTGSTFIISGSDVLGYSIVNTMGITVLPPQEFISGKQEVDVSGLVAGVYFVQMRTASGMMTKPIVVVH